MVEWPHFLNIPPFSEVGWASSANFFVSVYSFPPTPLRPASGAVPGAEGVRRRDRSGSTSPPLMGSLGSRPPPRRSSVKTGQKDVRELLKCMIHIMYHNVTHYVSYIQEKGHQSPHQPTCFLRSAICLDVYDPTKRSCRATHRKSNVARLKDSNNKLFWPVCL